MIELFKIIKGIYDPTCVPHVYFLELLDNLIRTIEVTISNLLNITDLRKFNMIIRVTPIWNSLSNHVVSADTINTFKDRLDKFWSSSSSSSNRVPTRRSSNIARGIGIL